MMLKKDVIAKVAEKAEVTKKDAAVYVDAFLDTILEALKEGESVRIVNFGTFEDVERAEREGRNPQTGETITIAATKTPTFKFSATTKKEIKECLK